MMYIVLTTGEAILLDPERQDDGEYELAYEMFLATPVNDILYIEAKGAHLRSIVSNFANIIYPASAKREVLGFQWYGDQAKTIVANILNSLYNNVSFIIDTTEDLYERRATINRRSS